MVGQVCILGIGDEEQAVALLLRCQCGVGQNAGGVIIVFVDFCARV